MKHRSLLSLFAFVAACSAAATVNADSLNYVASLTLEDTAGSVKTQLERTTQGNCARKLAAITKSAQDQPGITNITSSKCGAVAAVIGYFEKQSMGVPYVVMGENSVLIIRGANERVCNNLALLARQIYSGSTCIFPTKVYQ